VPASENLRKTGLPRCKKRSQEVGPPVRCNPFPCDPDRDTLPA